MDTNHNICTRRKYKHTHIDLFFIYVPIYTFLPTNKMREKNNFNLVLLQSVGNKYYEFAGHDTR